MDIDAKELTDYIANVLKGIYDSDNPALKDYSPTQGVTFDLRVVHKKGAKGGLKILIANTEGKYEKEVVSRITFTMQHKNATTEGIAILKNLFSEIVELDEKPKLPKIKKSK